MTTLTLSGAFTLVKDLTQTIKNGVSIMLPELHLDSIKFHYKHTHGTQSLCTGNMVYMSLSSRETSRARFYDLLHVNIFVDTIYRLSGCNEKEFREILCRTIAHELRHCWQHQCPAYNQHVEFRRGITNKCRYDDRPEEIDARKFEDNFTRSFLGVSNPSINRARRHARRNIL